MLADANTAFQGFCFGRGQFHDARLIRKFVVEVDPAEPFGDVEALVVDGDGGAFVAPDFGIVPDDGHWKH